MNLSRNQERILSIKNPASISSSFAWFLIGTIIFFALISSSSAQPAGTAVAWKWSERNGSEAYPLPITMPENLTNVTAISEGQGFVLMLKEDGTVCAWGDNHYGGATVPAGLSNVIAIATGSQCSAALKSDGTVTAWGQWFSNRGYRNNIPPSGLSNVMAIAANMDHSLALKSDGTVVCWGRNDDGQCMVPHGLSNVVAVSAYNDCSYALQGDGTVVSWGFRAHPPVNLSSPGVKPIAIAGGTVLKSDGTVVSLDNQNPGYSNAVSIVLGMYPGSPLSVLRSDGTVGNQANVFAIDGPVGIVGSGKPHITVHPAGYTVMADDEASLHVMVVSPVPVTYQWKLDGVDLVNATDHSLFIPNVQTDNAGNYTVAVGSSLGNVTSKSATLRVTTAPVILTPPAHATNDAGNTVIFSVRAKGKGPLMYQWRKNDMALSDAGNVVGATTATLTLNNISAVDAANYFVVVSNETGVATSFARLVVVTPPKVFTLPPAGRVVSFGGWGNNFGQWNIPGLTNAVALSASLYHNLALLENRTIFAWGNLETPIPEGLSDVVAVDTSMYHNLALKANGTVVGWGIVYREGGVRQTVTSPPAGLADVIAIAAGGDFGLALRKDGTVVSWGGGPVPLGVSNVVAIAASASTSFALTADGKVLVWGAGADSHDFPIDNHLSDGPAKVVAISAGANTGFLALKDDGTMVGYDNHVYATNVVAISRFGMGMHADGTIFKIDPNLHENTLTNNGIAVAMGWTHWLGIIGDGRPAITVNPYTQKVIAGQHTILRVLVASPTPVTYQWQLNGVDIPGATGSSFTVTNPTDTANAGPYAVVVSNSSGSVTSDNASLNQQIPAGIYSGLFYDSEGIELCSSGFLTMKVTSKRTFSGKVLSAGRSYGFTGKLYSRNGKVTVRRSNGTPLNLDLTLRTKNQNDQVTGTVSDGSWMADVLGDRAVFDSQNLTPCQGAYTMVLPVVSSSESTPGGDSFGNITVVSNGTIRFAANLSDNTVGGQIVPVSKEGNWPLYIPLYRGTGAVLGWITFTNTDRLSLEGAVSWIKTGAFGKNYPQGFTNESYAVGSTFSFSTNKSVLDITHGVAVLSGADLDQPIVQNVTPDSQSLTFTAPDGLVRKLSVNQKTGVFTGNLVNPADRKSLPVKGVVLQQQKSGSGFFVRPTQNGSFILQE